MVSWKIFQSANSVSFHVQLADEPEKVVNWIKSGSQQPTEDML